MANITRWMLLVPLLACACGRPSNVAGSAPNAATQQRASDEQSAARPIFEEANALMEKREYAKVLLRYQEALENDPDDPSILYNAGLAAFISKDFASAERLWGRLVELDPEDWRARTKLVQAHQAAGNIGGRDAARAKLFAMWKSGKLRELAQQERYCREQLEVAGRRLFVYEYFELEGDFPVRYAFVVLEGNKDVEDFRISLGSYEPTNQLARETGALKKGQRLFHLDGYYQAGSEHRTYGFFTGEPKYEEVRENVIQILEGKKNAISGSKWAKP